MKNALIEHADSSIIAVSFAHDQTDAQVIANAALHFPGSTVIGESDPATLPSWRFRDCWRCSGKTVTVDMALAGAQRLTEIRLERDTILFATDSLWLRANERRDDLARAALESKRQVLRDVPQMLLGKMPLDGVVCKALLSDCRTTDELESLVPAWPEL